MSIFSCIDSTVFVLDKITEVGPILNPHVPQVPYRFIVSFVGGGSSSFPSTDIPTLYEGGGNFVVRRYDFEQVQAERDRLILSLQGKT